MAKYLVQFYIITNKEIKLHKKRIINLKNIICPVEKEGKQIVSANESAGNVSVINRPQPAVHYVNNNTPLYLCYQKKIKLKITVWE